MRLAAGDLETLGTFLFGTRWQSALARAIHKSDRQVRRWVAGERPVSVQASRLIEELVRAKHSEQMRRLRAYYLDMVAGLSDTAIRASLMTMDLPALRVDDQLRRAGLSVPGNNGAKIGVGGGINFEPPSAAASVRDPALPARETPREGVSRL